MKLNKQTVNEILRFGIVGALTTALHYGIYLVLQHYINVNVAYTVGYFVSFVFNYISSARFTFKKKESVKNGLGFCGAHAFNYCLQLGLLNLFLWLGVGRSLAPVPVYCIAVPSNFLIVRLVFRKLK